MEDKFSSSHLFGQTGKHTFSFATEWTHYTIATPCTIYVRYSTLFTIILCTV